MFSNIANLKKTFNKIFRHVFHVVTIDRNFNMKIFKRQIMNLHKLYQKSICRWWKQFFLNFNIAFDIYENIYHRCSFSIMIFLNTKIFNFAQQSKIDFVRKFFNDIKFIIESTITKKTIFLITIVQSFLYVIEAKITEFDHVIKILICASNNFAIDDMIERMYRTVMKNTQFQNAIIIRMHSVIIENKMMKIMTRNENQINIEFSSTNDENAVDFISMTNDVQFDIASLISNAFREFQFRIFE